MKNPFFYIFFLCALSDPTFAQQTFLLEKVSKDFDIKITIKPAEADHCEGKATVFILPKKSTAFSQAIEIENLFLELGPDGNPTVNLIELYGHNNSGIILDDFNFDGANDLALRNGNHGAYGGPSYDVFLFSKAAKKFVKNLDLTQIASENLGFFTVDKKNTTLETFNKSGCCWHQTVRYRIINNQPVKVYIFTEDATAFNTGNVIQTTETLVNGRWLKETATVLRSKDDTQN
jgi:hypothetical protein